MQLQIDLSSIEDYRRFLRVKALPQYKCVGRTLEFPDEYAKLVMGNVAAKRSRNGDYKPAEFLYDYQAGIVDMAIRKRKFSIFAEPGRGKTLMMSELAKYAQSTAPRKNTLIISPLMVIQQTLSEIDRFYGGSLKIEHVASRDLQAWLNKGNGIAITNYEALEEDLERGRLGALLCDESSLLKSHYGKWGQCILRLGAGLQWKYCFTGTPAPNDRIEYANHAVFMDAFPTVNAFLAKFFVNRGQTGERWELKQHAIEPFYRALSHWCIFLVNPATYGWKDQTEPLPPIETFIHDVDLTDAQRKAVFSKTGSLFVSGAAGGITSRSTLGQIGKGFVDGQDVGSNKPGFIKSLVESWPDRSTIIWCIFNAEQDGMARLFPNGANISGDTPMGDRLRLIDDFKAGRRRVLISKPKVLGYGLNLQVCTRMVFSGLQDSYESYFQAIKRANRIGSTESLHVHIPITEPERPMVDNTIRKAGEVQKDTEEQERIFRKAMVMVA